LALKKKNGEFVLDFNKRFNNLYNKIPTNIKPSSTTTKVTYPTAHDLDFTIMLKKIRIATLDQMQKDEFYIEGNMDALDNIKLKVEIFDKKKKKEEDSTQPSTSSPQYLKIE